MRPGSKILKKMKEFICKIVDRSEGEEPDQRLSNEKDEGSDFGRFRVWVYVMTVYLIIFGYIGYVAFWPMAFNDPEQNVEKYFSIVKKYSDQIGDGGDRALYTETINELIKRAEAEANDIQQLASQSFNIVLGAFLAFLSATVTTIFQRRRQ